MNTEGTAGMTTSYTALLEQGQAAVLALAREMATTVGHIPDPAEAAQTLFLDVLENPSYTREGLAAAAALLAVRLHRAAVTTPGARHCRCDWLGPGTPEHDVSALCVGLRPDADRDPAPAGNPHEGKSLAELERIMDSKEYRNPGAHPVNTDNRCPDVWRPAHAAGSMVGDCVTCSSGDRPDCTIAEHHADD